MERHGILRERDEWLADLKSMMDSRSQTMKLMMKINNQLLAYERQTDDHNPDEIAFLIEASAPIKKRLGQIDRKVTKHVEASPDPLVKAALGVTGLGPMTIAGLTVYVDLEKANSASAMWSYTGLHKASHERYKKGQASGGNKTLRTIMWNCAASMMKNPNCPYREVYDRTKTRLAASEKIVKSYNVQGILIEVPWKDAMPKHRHGAALRAIQKHLLADYWFVGRELAGLPTRPLYVEGQLGHTGIIRPGRSRLGLVRQQDMEHTKKTEAIAAMRRLHADTTVHPIETLNALREIREEIDIWIEALEAEMEP